MELREANSASQHIISHKEKLALEKDIFWSVGRAIIQLIIVGYVLKYIFSVDDASLTLLMVLFICFNAAWNAQKRSKYIAKAFISSLRTTMFRPGKNQIDI